MWLCHRTTVDSFVGFRVGDSNDKVVSIRQKNHINSLFVNIVLVLSRLFLLLT